MGFIILGKQKKRVIKIGLVGMPDILCIKKFKGLPILIGFEIKGEDGELNENQIIMKKNLEQYYVKYFVVNFLFGYTVFRKKTFLFEFQTHGTAKI